MHVVYIKKKKPALKVGDILFCWDDDLKRSITGYILRVVENIKLNAYDVYIRWNDPFVVLRKHYNLLEWGFGNTI